MPPILIQESPCSNMKSSCNFTFQLDLLKIYYQLGYLIVSKEKFFTLAVDSFAPLSLMEGKGKSFRVLEFNQSQRASFVKILMRFFKVRVAQGRNGTLFTVIGFKESESIKNVLMRKQKVHPMVR
ncbi:uncharacterized protein LOC129882569 isoform X2 [Solanum dulcamara]|uniref:uncharacterized protein LOC129882569 isoform X2 n=1 Tax=Solanum dulcamara TaxID=45834 RepID=UPI002485FF40|nr:uncharacterized protein LOC129882569 isoform X2 [Solanum dulcamara]